MKKILIILILAFVLTSCIEKEEKNVNLGLKTTIDFEDNKTKQIINKLDKVGKKLVEDLILAKKELDKKSISEIEEKIKIHLKSIQDEMNDLEWTKEENSAKITRIVSKMKLYNQLGF